MKITRKHIEGKLARFQSFFEDLGYTVSLDTHSPEGTEADRRYSFTIYKGKFGHQPYFHIPHQGYSMHKNEFYHFLDGFEEGLEFQKANNLL